MLPHDVLCLIEAIKTTTERNVFGHHPSIVRGGLIFQTSRRGLGHDRIPRVVALDSQLLGSIRGEVVHEEAEGRASRDHRWTRVESDEQRPFLGGALVRPGVIHANEGAAQ